jgi:hypothetical protein
MIGDLCVRRAPSGQGASEQGLRAAERLELGLLVYSNVIRGKRRKAEGEESAPNTIEEFNECPALTA